MKGTPQPVTVRILDKEYRVACPDEERDALLAAAQHLNKRMKEIHDSGRVVGTERIAVMAALNITHELLQDNSSNDGLRSSMSNRIRLLQDKIEHALNKGQQMEL